MRWLVLVLPGLLAACTSQFSLGPTAWNSVPPVVPGFHAVPLGGGGFIEEPDPPAVPAATSEQTVLQALQEAQATRLAVRQLAR